MGAGAMKFGTSGLRGLVVDMTDALCADYVAAFLSHLAAEGVPPPAVLVGRDLRPSSPRIVAAALGAIAAAGVEAVDCGALPTPALALEAARRGVPAVMVTGSHIPFDRNGIKFYRAEGEITKADELGILAALGQARPETVPGRVVGDDGAAAAGYLERALGFFPAGVLAGWRVGVYQHSAVGRDLIGATLTGLGAEVVALGRADHFVPIDTEAIRPEDAALARGWTAEHRLDALLSTDGDGDRPLIAGEDGVFLRGDLIGILAARFLGAEAVATPISSNTAVERCGWFTRVARTRIGSPYVIEAMEALRAEGASLVAGYEANGGFLLGGAAVSEAGAVLSPLPTRDAMLPMLCVLVMAARGGMALSELAALLPARATASDRLVDFAPERSAALLRRLAAEAEARGAVLSALGLEAALSVDTLDGVRMSLAGDEVAHLRASGNAPELRVYAEAATGARAEEIVALVLARVSGMAV